MLQRYHLITDQTLLNSGVCLWCATDLLLAGLGTPICVQTELPLLQFHVSQILLK